MFTIPAIDMVATGRNITKLREAAGLTVRDLQNIFGFATPQAIYKWQHIYLHSWLYVKYGFVRTNEKPGRTEVRDSHYI